MTNRRIIIGTPVIDRKLELEAFRILARLGKDSVDGKVIQALLDELTFRDEAVLTMTVHWDDARIESEYAAHVIQFRHDAAQAALMGALKQNYAKKA